MEGSIAGKKIISETVLVGGTHTDPTGQHLGNWYSTQCGKKLSAPFLILGWVKKDTLKGVLVFNDYNGTNISVHAWIPHGLSQGKIKFVLNYVFNQLKCSRLTALLGEDQSYVRSLVERGGFVKEGHLKNWWGEGKDGVVYRMLKADAQRWLEME
jgi:RimJ/RimL family protein N-acetyltransferase